MDILKDLVRNTYHRYIPPDVKIIEHNGYVFFAHPTKRFAPIIGGIGALAGGAGGLLSGAAGAAMQALPMAGKIAGPLMSMLGTREEGKETEKIAEYRAAIDIANAEAVRRVAVEKARIKTERGRRLLERQKGIAAAGGIRLGVGAPLVIEAQTRADIAKDIGFVLETGREVSRLYRLRAEIERAIGKKGRKKSKWSVISQGLKGFGSIAMMGRGAEGLTTKGLTTTGSHIKGLPSGRYGMDW